MKGVKRTPSVLAYLSTTQPNSASIRNGTYPLVTEVYAVIPTGEEGSPRAMFDWLVTADGQGAIAATGYVKLP